MSKDIWHKADEAPRYRFQCIYYHRDSKEYYFGEYDATFRVFLGKKTFHQDEAWKFAFAEDVIACLDELERTRKALDVAIRGLDQMTWGCDSTDAEYLLKEIKETQEQKDVK